MSTTRPIRHTLDSDLRTTDVLTRNPSFGRERRSSKVADRAACLTNSPSHRKAEIPSSTGVNRVKRSSSFGLGLPSGLVTTNAARSCNHHTRGWNRTLHPTPALPRELSDGCGPVLLLGFWTVGRLTRHSSLPNRNRGTARLRRG